MARRTILQRSNAAHEKLFDRNLKKHFGDRDEKSYRLLDYHGTVLNQQAKYGRVLPRSIKRKIFSSCMRSVLPSNWKKKFF